ncbi:MAG: hypothetical protein UHX00_04615 [Caryophanon sp.]|nr:hypothetical protein [Caryophanon sp.]
MNQELKSNISKTIESLDSNIITNDYITLSQFSKLLGYKKHPDAKLSEEIITFCSENNIEVIQTTNCVNRNKIFFNKNDVHHFFKEYISADNLVASYNVSYRELVLMRIHSDLSFLKLGRKIFHQKDQIIELINTKRKYESEDYLTTEEVRKLLKLPVSYLMSTIREEENLSCYTIYNTRYGEKKYLKRDVVKLVNKQNFYRENYYSSEQVVEFLGYHPPSIFIKPAEIKLTALLRATFSHNGSQPTRFYEKKIIDEYVKRKEKKDSKTQLISSDGLSSYNLLCLTDNLYFSDNTKETESAWEQFVVDHFKNTNRNSKSLRNLINALVNSKKVLIKFLGNKELRKHSANDINTNIFNEELPNEVKRKIYTFLNKHHQNCILENKKVYSLKYILNPFKVTNTTSKAKDIYDFNYYQDLVTFVADTKKHKSKAIDDASNKVLGKKTVHYASMWLYVLIHLNNAWRSTDIVTSLPRLDIGTLNKFGVYSLEQFKQMELTHDVAKKILFHYKIKEYVMNKNGNLNRLNCSEQLTDAFATSIVICSLVSHELTPIIDLSSEDFKHRDQLFLFQNSRFLPLRTAYNGFFKTFSCNSITKFESRKMNRSILVYMYLFLTQHGLSSQALEISKRLRAHYDYETTNIYLTIPNEELDNVLNQLFTRGSFGYIPRLLSQVIYRGDGLDKDIELETNQIKSIKKLFKDTQDIEVFSGFLNKVLEERLSVADEILKLSFKEASAMLFEINTNIIPSRQENILCLKAHTGCVKPFKEDNNAPCHGCAYAIPNFYSIASLVSRIKETLIHFSENFKNTKGYDFERRKIVNHLYMYLDEFQAARDEFGEVVFDFFENGKDEYNKYIDLIDQVDLGDTSLENYLTYEPKHL